MAQIFKFVIKYGRHIFLSTTETYILTITNTSSEEINKKSKNVTKYNTQKRDVYCLFFFIAGVARNK